VVIRNAIPAPENDMNTLEELQAFLARNAAEMNASTIPDFIRCFDEDALPIDHATASANWPSRQAGELTAQTPEAGNGHYAHIQMRGFRAGQHGEAIEYVMVAPDWSMTGHVTMPAIGGEPDAVVESFTGESAGARRFAAGAAAQA
jgi:hypothetical protein